MLDRDSQRALRRETQREKQVGDIFDLVREWLKKWWPCRQGSYVVIYSIDYWMCNLSYLANPFQRTTRSALYGFPGESLLTSTKWTKFETMKKIATHVLYRLWLFKHRHGMTWGSFFTRDLEQLLRDCRRRYLEAILEHFAVLKGDCYMRICLLWKKIWFLKHN